MKVIDLLIQGKKVAVEGKNGYYYMEGNKILFHDLNSGEVWDNFFISNSYLLEEGQEFSVNKYDNIKVLKMDSSNSVKKSLRFETFDSIEKLNKFLSSIDEDDVKEVRLHRREYGTIYSVLYRKEVNK